jgi:hypothetical protein
MNREKREAIEKTTEEERKENERNELLKPYITALSVNDLPKIQFDMSKLPPESHRFVLKPNETIHAITKATLNDIRKDKKWIPGSRASTIRLGKGLSFKVGSAKGYYISKDILVEISRGFLLITNKRLAFQTILPQDKPLSLKLSDIESYSVTEDAITIFKERRERPFIFKLIENHYDVMDDILGITLNLVLSEV